MSERTAPRTATVAVVGAGQAGLSAAHHLLRRGLAPATSEPDAPRTVVVLDEGCSTSADSRTPADSRVVA